MVNVVVFGIDLIIAGIFVGFGVIAGKGRRWCFLLGMCLYGLDSLIFIVAEDALGFAFHLMALYFIYQGYRASRICAASTLAPAARQPAADARGYVKNAMTSSICSSVMPANSGIETYSSASRSVWKRHTVDREHRLQVVGYVLNTHADTVLFYLVHEGIAAVVEHA